MTPTAPENLLNIKGVMARTALSKSGIYQMMARGDFPRPLRISHKCARWPASIVDRWIAEAIARAA